MKKILLFIVAALFVAVSANAQDENNALVSLLKVNFEGVSPNYTPTGDNQIIVEPTDEGLAKRLTPLIRVSSSRTARNVLHVNHSTMGLGTRCICNLGDYRIAYARLTPHTLLLF